MVSVTNPLMDSEIWGAKLAGKCVVCWSNKAVAPHPTISAVPLPDATLARLIMPTNHIAHFNKLSFIPYSSTSAIIDFQLNHHLMNKNND